ncbi:hypothetical protein ACFFGR_15260 [Arthrobacter liuii]|uniref:Uncharacterized protein n=2 Tax=Arthrobacter liuii TaxID=1476996 RepID=A0ABQ2B0C4_9MICC|nr:hypothetical protein [Arthrobacter liuii]GGI01451.1 hypothetical protein GCM10007170_40920 [Arthrobacter liuii]
MAAFPLSNSKHDSFPGPPSIGNLLIYSLQDKDPSTSSYPIAFMKDGTALDDSPWRGGV